MPKQGSVWHPKGPVVSIERKGGRTIALWLAEIKVETMVGWSLTERVGDVAKIEMEFYPSDLIIRGDQRIGGAKGEWEASPGEYFDSLDKSGEIVGGGIAGERWES